MQTQIGFEKSADDFRSADIGSWICRKKTADILRMSAGMFVWQAWCFTDADPHFKI